MKIATIVEGFDFVNFRRHLGGTQNVASTVCLRLSESQQLVYTPLVVTPNPSNVEALASGRRDGHVHGPEEVA